MELVGCLGLTELVLIGGVDGGSKRHGERSVEHGAQVCKTDDRPDERPEQAVSEGRDVV